jgi:hypothetical protein
MNGIWRITLTRWRSIRNRSPDVYAGTSPACLEARTAAKAGIELNLAGLQYPNVTSVAINPFARRIFTPWQRQRLRQH